MDTAALLTDHVERIRELYAGLLDGLTTEEAHRRPEGPNGTRGNPVVWLLWHTARVQDDHVAALADVPQAWREWAPRFDLPLDLEDFGYGHDDAQVDAVRVEDLSLLGEYHQAVHRLTVEHVSGLGEDDLDRVVDEHWDPPVTAGVRLVSVVGDCLQHLGQAAYVRGLLNRG